MEFIQKGLFYVMFGITSFIILYLLTMSVSIFLEPYGKKSEIVIMLIGTVLLGAGLYITYCTIKTSERYAYACGMLGLTWVITLAVIIIGILFFSGPLKWN